MIKPTGKALKKSFQKLKKAMLIYVINMSHNIRKKSKFLKKSFRHNWILIFFYFSPTLPYMKYDFEFHIYNLFCKILKYWQKIFFCNIKLIKFLFYLIFEKNEMFFFCERSVFRPFGGGEPTKINELMKL